MIENNTWGEKLDYLQSTRTQFWNDDYLEFLVKYVWNIDQPQNIVDFGCGYGYLGLKLLPLLPAGSTYTGIDIAEPLNGRYRYDDPTGGVLHLRSQSQSDAGTNAGVPG